jgi:hypothetical protein
VALQDKGGGRRTLDTIAAARTGRRCEEEGAFLRGSGEDAEEVSDMRGDEGLFRRDKGSEGVRPSEGVRRSYPIW